MPRTTRSSLADHRFPAFYACYLLKSVRTPRATATYIGSTPSPPRRIRQHNGEIAQGAWKTKHSRPWVMQMIVHGFPSKLAALQFEWAWQHPYISRHLRDDGGNAKFNGSGKFKYMNTNVKVARSMVSSHPYNTWPLRVKLFTKEAAKIWENATNDASMLPLPPGLEVTVELEGVDGKSGEPGSGRTGAIDVMDASFTAEHLQKAGDVFTPNSRLQCSICHEVIPHDADPLTTALCPTSTCTAVSHLTCLSRHFLANGLPSSNSDMIPRGGTCRACHTYTLWGDVIRGCYRRRQGGATPENDAEEVDDQEAGLGQLFGDAEEDLEGPHMSTNAGETQPRTKKRSKARAPPASKPRSRPTAPSAASSSDEREHLDLNAISSCDEGDESDGHFPWSQPRAPPKPVPRTKAARTGINNPGRGLHSIADSMLARPVPTSSRSQTRGGLDRAPHQASHTLTSGATEAAIEDRNGEPSIMPSERRIASAGSPSLRGPWPGTLQDEMSRRPRSTNEKQPSTFLSPLAREGGKVVHAMAALPPPGHIDPAVASGTTEEASVARETVRKLKPFPDLPPLSQPPLSANDRGQRAKPLDNEVVEISDSD